MSRFPKWECARLEYKTIDHFRDLAKMIIVGGGLSDKNVEKFYNNIWGVRKRDSLQILTL